MKNKTVSASSGQFYESFDIKEYQAQKSNINRFDYDLFDENKHISQDVFRIKHSASPKRGEKWKIFKNNELLFELNANKLAKKEKEYLRSVNGTKFLLKQVKASVDNIKNIKKLKLLIKKESV